MPRPRKPLPVGAEYIARVTNAARGGDSSAQQHLVALLPDDNQEAIADAYVQAGADLGNPDCFGFPQIPAH